nr:TPA_asm: RNA-dependent RNA polymerase [Doliuvirus atrichopogon]
MFCKIAEVDDNDVLESMLDNISDYLDSIRFWFLNTEINVICTTPLACVNTVREIGIPFFRQQNVVTDFEANLSDLAIHVDLPFRQAPYSLILSSPREVSDVGVETPLLLNIPRGILTLQSTHSYRSIGINNATCNHLTSILLSINYNYTSYLDNMRYSIMGDGLGNGCMLFSALSRNSTFVFTTMPDEQFLHIDPVAALSISELNNNVIHSNHIRQGIWDLKHKDTYEGLYNLYGGSNIYFCDAETNKYDPEFPNIYINVCEYFVETRVDEGLLILQVSADYMDVIMKCLAYLSYNCQSVLMTQPRSIFCGLNFYIVAYGRSNMNFGVNKVLESKLSFLQHTELARFIERTSAYWNNLALAPDITIRFRSSIPKLNEKLAILPPLWVSLYNKLLGQLIDNKYLESLRISSSRPTPHHYSMLYQLNTIENMRSIYQSLTSNVPQENTHAEAYYSSDFQAHRIHIIRRYLSHMGFNWALQKLTTPDLHAFTEKQAKDAYVSALSALQRRDFDPTHDYPDLFMRKMIGKRGEVLDYWSAFVLGVQLVQTIIAWTSSLQTRGG